MQEEIAHTERSELERPRTGKPTLVEPRDLHAAAAEIERGPARHCEVVDRSHEPQTRFGVTVDDLQRHPELASAIEQHRSVGGVADRRRRDREDALRSRAVGDGSEVPKSLKRSIDRLGSELVSGAKLARQPKRRPCVLEHIQVLAFAQPEHDHPRGVRPDVENGERPVVALDRTLLGGHEVDARIWSAIIANRGGGSR